jgi:hypothetical protein
LVATWNTNAIGFTIETSTNLSPTAIWSTVNGAYSISGSSYEHHETRIDLPPMKFFRLRFTGSPVPP